ncbi:hypothetical protein CEXT_809161 [Caerostris extrusa]|uniref:Uncharacterized protein n=1 Tax=Caerostris extrusa TaxID=172846 RepID=A0AAV4Y664_CAEEX|nr:hypothetical protein CEXT_809161 [Caerostris extrusa]
MECTVSLLAFRKPYSIKYENNLKQQQQNSIRLDLLLVSLTLVTRLRIENHGVTFTKTLDSSLREEPLITQHSFAELTQSMIGNHIFHYTILRLIEIVPNRPFQPSQTLQKCGCNKKIH